MRFYVKLFLMASMAAGANWMLRERADQLDEAAFFLRVYAYQMVGQTYSEDLIQAAGQMSERSWERYRRRTANQTV